MNESQKESLLNEVTQQIQDKLQGTPIQGKLQEYELAESMKEIYNFRSQRDPLAKAPLFLMFFPEDRSTTEVEEVSLLGRICSLFVK